MKTSLFGRIMPGNNKTFFNLFDDAAATALEMASLLYQSVSSANPQDLKMNFNVISRLKEKGNNIKREMYALSGQAFISPFSRDDMYALSSALNTLSDFIDIASRRVNFYNIVVTEPVKELAGLIVDCCSELTKLIVELQDISQSEVIEAHVENIKKLEHQADIVNNKAMSALIEKETDPLEIMKYSEIFSVLERATDKCELVVNVIETVIVKNS
ncbi:DUF47 domain-containing protein [Mucilaginibacter ginkgonis]|uniref:DUF47 family protein n=1 Tax=Mucilaginibacter ginkgonis TaxID=2682091 RepID=A0A6I4INJ0_9SPHI|nr:DUF47 family protein [Mucilaginibacter ginkgonis]QQL49624.1 DUF47 family protein [Mucilaginibacter ginkgonis]